MLPKGQLGMVAS